MKNIKKNKLIAIIVFILVAIVTTVLIITLVNKKDKYRLFQLVTYEGGAVINRLSNETNSLSNLDLFEGLMLIPGDVAKTLANGHLSFLADDDKHIILNPSSEVSIETKGNQNKGYITLNLKQGNIVIDIENKLNEDSQFKVISPNAILAVRGTTFEVDYTPKKNRTVVYVKSGVVAAKTSADGDEKLVHEGEILIIDSTVLNDPINVENLNIQNIKEYFEMGSKPKQNETIDSVDSADSVDYERIYGYIATYIDEIMPKVSSIPAETLSTIRFAGYTYYDMNADQIPELFVYGSTVNSPTYLQCTAIFSIQDNEPVYCGDFMGSYYFSHGLPRIHYYDQGSKTHSVYEIIMSGNGISSTVETSNLILEFSNSDINPEEGTNILQEDDGYMKNLTDLQYNYSGNALINEWEDSYFND